jgi:predicted metal-binding membrane protein
MRRQQPMTSMRVRWRLSSKTSLLSAGPERRVCAHSDRKRLASVAAIGENGRMTVRLDAPSIRVAGPTLAAAAVAWVVVVDQAAGMQSAPGTMGLGAAAFVGLWTVMMAAMMLPALVPVGVLYAGDGDGRETRAAGLAVGYLVAWAAFGVLALLISAAAGRLAARSDTAAEWIGAAVLVAAGVYQLSPLKDRCLSACRSPLGMLMRVGAYRGATRHVRAGAYHGAYCVGCCWSLMVALIALGVMNLWWMVALTLVITLEKVWRHGRRVALAAGAGLIVLGLLAPWFPGIIPGLHAPPGPMMGM